MVDCTQWNEGYERRERSLYRRCSLLHHRIYSGRKTMKKLTELSPEWRKSSEQEGRLCFATVETKAEADQIWFECPACDTGHYIRIAIEPSGKIRDGEPVWKHSGTTFEDLTITPSINCVPKGKKYPKSCAFHGWIREGIVTW